jgi:hypothetical protein
LHLSYNEAVPVVDEMFFGFVSYFDVEILLRLPPKGIAALAVRSHAKDNPAISISYYGVWCFAMCS